jgi:multidrug efflux pump subunit AcrA (membrane-fusion protein)
MRGKWVLISVSLVLLAVAAGALSHLRRSAVQATAPPVTVPAKPVVDEVSLPGKIEAQQVVLVESASGGSVAEFQADVGQEVTEGALLARISNQALQSADENARAAVEMAQARVEKAGAAITAARLESTRAHADAIRARGGFDRAQRTYQRQKMLHAEGATPRLTYEKSERDYESAQTESDSLEKLARVAEDRVSELVKEQESAKRILEDKLKDAEDAKTNLVAAEVRSPVDGQVVERRGEVGKELTQQDQAELFRIAVNLSELQVRVNPDPDALKRMKAGDQAMVIVADLGGEGIPATVKTVEGSTATAAFTSPNPVVKPGMSAQVRIKMR